MMNEKKLVDKLMYQNSHFIVINNERLKFKNAEKIIKEFIKCRLEYFGVSQVSFISKEEVSSETKKQENHNKILVIMDVMNPLTDMNFVLEMINRLVSSGKKVALQDGMIPGTQVEYILNKGVEYLHHQKNDILRSRCNSQLKYNNQFNLYKYKRLKMFLFLERNISDMYKLSIDEFNDKLSEEALFKKLSAYGENIETFEHDSCPYCSGCLVPLPLTMSQPFCGYLSSAKPLYHECDSCGLVVSSPFVDVSNISLIYDSFDTEDFAKSHNNPYTNGSKRCDLSSIMTDLPSSTRSLDLGGGMGNFSKYLKSEYPGWSVTHSDFSSKVNRELEELGIETRSINFLSESIGQNCFDVITAWEVIEHIPFDKLSSWIDNIYDALSPGGFFIFSTPDFDSPLCRSNDFFAMCPPFHYLVFGKNWLQEYFSSDDRWSLYPMRSCSDFLDDSEMWGDYASSTAPSFQLRASASVMKLLLNDNRNREKLLKNGMGTEVIVTLRKKS